MRTLVVAPQPFFSPRGTPFSVYYRTLVMGEQGVSIDLLTYGQGEDVDLPNTRIIRIPGFRFLGAVKTGPSLLKLFLDIFMAAWTFGLLLRYRYDVVHAHEEAVFFCRFFKPVFGFKLVYDMHSSLPQQLDTFKFTKSSLIKKLFTALESSAIKHADAVVTICPDLADYVKARIDTHQRHVLIENSIFDPVNLLDQSDATLSTKDGPDHRKTISPGVPVGIYAGTFEVYQGLDLLLQGFELVCRKIPDARLLMVGGSLEQQQQYRTMARNLGIADRVIFMGRVPPDHARRLILSADVLTSPRSAGTNTPLKIYEQLASGKPIVATRIKSHTQVLTHQVALLVEPTPQGMAEGILQVLSDPQEAARRAALAKELYHEKYSRPVYTEKITRLLALLD